MDRILTRVIFFTINSSQYFKILPSLLLNYYHFELHNILISNFN